MQQPNFRALAWYPIVTVGLVMAAFNIVRTGRDAVFFDQQGLERLPLVNIWVCIAAIPVAYVNLKAMSRWGSRAARTGLCVLGALVLLLFVPWLEREHVVLLGVARRPRPAAQPCRAAERHAGDQLVVRCVAVPAERRARRVFGNHRVHEVIGRDSRSMRQGVHAKLATDPAARRSAAA